MDNLYYIEAVDISRGIIGEMAFCFNDKKSESVCPPIYPISMNQENMNGYFHSLLKV